MSDESDPTLNATVADADDAFTAARTLAMLAGTLQESEIAFDELVVEIGEQDTADAEDGDLMIGPGARK